MTDEDKKRFAFHGGQFHASNHERAPCTTWLVSEFDNACLRKLFVDSYALRRTALTGKPVDLRLRECLCTDPINSCFGEWP